MLYQRNRLILNLKIFNYLQIFITFICCIIIIQNKVDFISSSLLLIGIYALRMVNNYIMDILSNYPYLASDAEVMKNYYCYLNRS